MEAPEDSSKVSEVYREPTPEVLKSTVSKSNLPYPVTNSGKPKKRKAGSSSTLACSEEIREKSVKRPKHRDAKAEPDVGE